jgi:hypothetical protein
MNLEFTTIDNRRIRYAASRRANSPQLRLVNPNRMSILTDTDRWERLATRFDLVAVDLPNHGGSDVDDSVVTASQQAAFLPFRSGLTRPGDRHRRRGRAQPPSPDRYGAGTKKRPPTVFTPLSELSIAAMRKARRKQPASVSLQNQRSICRADGGPPSACAASP